MDPVFLVPGFLVLGSFDPGISPVYTRNITELKNLVDILERKNLVNINNS